MINLTLLEAVVLHRWQWSVLAETGGTKEGSVFWEQSGYDQDEVLSMCFLCSYAWSAWTRSCADWNPGSAVAYCFRCSVEWDYTCNNGSSLFAEWWRADVGSLNKKSLAAQIRDLPLRPWSAAQLGELW